MKHILLILLVFTSINLNAQNGGQAPENEMIKLENVASGVKVTNKQSCRVEFRTNQTDNFHLASYSDTIIQGLKGKFKVKPLDKCQSGDMGWVEIDVNSSLPVKFENINIKNNILYFTTSSENNVKEYVVEYSTNGNSWKEVSHIKPKGNSTYSINLSSILLTLPFLLLFIPFKRKSVLFFTVSAVLLFACTKSTILKTDENVLLRVKQIDNNNNLSYSNIIHYKKIN